MGYQTDFVGYLHVQPALNEAEVAFVNATRGRFDRDYATLRTVDDVEASQIELMSGAPYGWSNWEACSQGCCLGYDGGDKASHMIPWLKYLMATYLVPVTEMLWPGVPEWSDYPALGYQRAIDRFRQWRATYRLEEARKRVRELRAEVKREYSGE